MDTIFTLKKRLIFTVFVTILIGIHLAWDYLHEGVPTHTILADENLPGISNWWSIISIPLFTWFLLFRIKKRVTNDGTMRNIKVLRKIIYRFVASILIGILLSILFYISESSIDYIMLCLFLLSFTIPLYWSEYLLGYVLATSFTFGAFIPIVFGSALLLIYFILYKTPRIIGKILFQKKNKQT